MNSKLITAKFDTDPTEQCSVSLDYGRIPFGYPNAGDFVVTLQIHPLPDEKAARVTAEAVAQAVGSRLGVKIRPVS